MRNILKKVSRKAIPSTDQAAEIISRLKLTPHPEGGWYSEIYRSDEIIHNSALPERYSEPHNFSTSIYFLLGSNDFSAFHRIRSDETWHFYKGSPVAIYVISPQGEFSEIIMGNNLRKQQQLQFTIKRGSWFAAKIKGNGPYALVGCTVSPGFEFADFELGIRQKLTEKFPQLSKIICEFTRF